MGAWDPFLLVRPGLLGVVGIPLSRSVEVFLFCGTPRFGCEAIGCWESSDEASGSFRHYHRPAVEAGLPVVRGSIGAVRPAEAGDCWDFT